MNRLLSIWCDVILLWHAIEMYTTEQYTGGLLMPRYTSRQKITSQDRGGLKQCKETPEPLTTWLICSIYSSLTLSCSCCTWSDLLDTESKTQQRSSHTHTLIYTHTHTHPYTLYISSGKPRYGRNNIMNSHFSLQQPVLSCLLFIIHYFILLTHYSLPSETHREKVDTVMHNANVLYWHTNIQPEAGNAWPCMELDNLPWLEPGSHTLQLF